MEKITKTDAEWRAQLSELAYKVARKHGTERAGSHEDFPKGPGIYHCVGCGAPLSGFLTTSTAAINSSVKLSALAFSKTASVTV